MPTLAGDDRILGTQGFIIYDARPGEEDPLGIFPVPVPPSSNATIEIPITLWRLNLEKSLADLTSTVQYWKDPTSGDNLPHGFIFGAHTQVAINVDGWIEGRFRLSRLPQRVIYDLFSDSATPRIVFGLTFSYIFADSYCTVRKFSMSAPHNDVVSYTAEVKSFGVFNMNTSPGYPDF